MRLVWGDAREFYWAGPGCPLVGLKLHESKGQFQHCLNDLSGTDRLASGRRFLKPPVVEENEQKHQKKWSITVRNGRNILLRRLVHFKKP